MSRWRKISLYKFQQIEQVNQRQDYSDMDKTLFSVCIIFGMTEYELDHESPRVVKKLLRKAEKIFKSPLNQAVRKRIGRYLISYDISRMTFGQYIELAFFLQGKPLQQAHNVLASASRLPLTKRNASGHHKRAEYFRRQPVAPIVAALGELIKRFNEFNAMHKDLFGTGTEEGKQQESDPFNRRFGWMFSATQVAEHERIKLDEAYALPVMHAFNTLKYLKAKAQYEERQLRQQNIIK